MKRRTTLLLTLITILLTIFPIMPTTAQDADPYTLDSTLGRGLVRSLAWSPDGEILAVGGVLGIWLYKPVPEAIGFEDVGLLTGHTKAVYGLAFSPDGSRLASVSHDKTVHIWDVESQTELHTMVGHTDLVVAVDWSADNFVATGSYDGTIRLWNPNAGEWLGIVGTHDGWVDDLTFDSDGSRLASVGHDGMLRVWDVASGSVLWEVLAHESGAQAVDWSSGSLIFTAGRNGWLKAWANGILFGEFQVHDGVIYDVEVQPMSTVVGTASWDGTAKQWLLGDPDYYWLLSTLLGHTGRVQRIAMQPGGNLVATLGWDDTVRLWDENGTEIAAKNEHMDFITALAWDDNALVSVTLDGRANIWDVDSGDLLDTAAGRSEAPSLSADSPDGSRRAAIDDGGIVRIVDAASGDLIMELPGRANAVTWSPDGSRLAVAQRNGTIAIWRAES